MVQLTKNLKIRWVLSYYPSVDAFLGQSVGAATAMQLLSEGLNQLGLKLEAITIDQLMAFLNLLFKWNQTYNLTGIKTLEAMVTHHLLDTLSLCPFIMNQPQIQRIIDVGTGAGLPGIPLALCFPDKAMTLLDSVGKKLRFLAHVCHQLKLPEVCLVQSRVEQYQPEQPFDLILTRGFSSLNTIVACTQHMTTKHSMVLAMKGCYPSEELSEFKRQDSPFKVVNIQPIHVPFLNAQRHLVFLSQSP